MKRRIRWRVEDYLWRIAIHRWDRHIALGHQSRATIWGTIADIIIRLSGNNKNYRGK